MPNTIYERRQYHRMSAVNHGIAMVLRDQVISYQVEDIGQGGIGFVYAGLKEWVGDSSHLDFIDRRMFLEDVEVKVISDVPLDSDEEKGSVIPLRRVGLKFLKLSDQQKDQLDEYLLALPKIHPAPVQGLS